HTVGPKETLATTIPALGANTYIVKVFIDHLSQLANTQNHRYIPGGAKPESMPPSLETIHEFKAPYFLERRELGIINVGGSGKVSVDGEVHELGFKEALYVGKGRQKVVFSSDDAGNPAKFYLNSAPAHHAYPTRKVTKAEAEV